MTRSVRLSVGLLVGALIFLIIIISNYNIEYYLVSRWESIWYNRISIDWRGKHIFVMPIFESDNQFLESFLYTIV